MLKILKKLFFNDYIFCSVFVASLLGLISIIPINHELTDPFGQALGDFEVTDLAFTTLRIDKTESDSGAFSSLRPVVPEADTNIVIVNLGYAGNAEMAAIINNLNEFQPAVIGINRLIEKSGDDFADSLLKEALSSTKKLVLISRLTGKSKNELSWTDVKKPDKSIIPQNNNTIVAYNNLLTTDRDFKTTRHFIPQTNFKGQLQSFFPVELVKATYPEKAREFISREKEIEVINYLGNLDKFYSIDVEQALNKEFDPGIIKNKIVILGYLGESLSSEKFWDTDKYYTPMNKKYAGKTFPDMFETVIYANVVSQVLSNEHINVVSPFVDFILNLIVCFLNVVIFSRLFHAAAVWWDTLSIVITLIEIVLLLVITTLIFGLFNIEINLNFSIVFVLVLGSFLELYYGLFKIALQKFSVKYLILQETNKRDELKDIMSGSTRDILIDPFSNQKKKK